MAINKTINKSTKSHGAMRNCIEYVLKESKITNKCVYMTGPSPENLSWDTVYQSFLAEKRLWHKDSGRMYAHNIISFHKDEAITPEQALDFGKEFVEKWFPNHQTLISVHQDKDHIHIHLVTNSVSFIDGKKLHNSKQDLEHMKQLTNSMCLARGLTIAEKGKHFDGNSIEEGTFLAWNKDKYHFLENEDKKSYLVNCAIAVLESKEQCCSKDDFFKNMKARGWQTVWTDSKKHITFKNENGEKVRDSNLSKSFSIDISKGALLHEFERQNEVRLSTIRREEAELRQYYAEVESAISGSTDEAIRGLEETVVRTRPAKRAVTGQSTVDTNNLLREIRNEIRDSQAKSRAVIYAENKSISTEEQRRSKEQQRIDAQRRAREIKKSSRRIRGPSR